MQDTIYSNLNTQKSTFNKKIAIIIFIFIVAAILGGILLLRQSKKTGQSENVLVENKEPSPTEKSKIDKNLVKTQVLNGTGTPGQAGIVVEALKKAGYNSDNIKTANAQDFNNTVTTIAAKDGFDDVANDIKDVLTTTFDEIKIDSTHLGKDSEFDIVVTTGGKIFEEVTPTSTPTPTLTLTPTLSPTPTP